MLVLVGGSDLGALRVWRKARRPGFWTPERNASSSLHDAVTCLGFCPRYQVLYVYLFVYADDHPYAPTCYPPPGGPAARHGQVRHQLGGPLQGGGGGGGAPGAAAGRQQPPQPLPLAGQARRRPAQPQPQQGPGAAVAVAEHVQGPEAQELSQSGAQPGAGEAAAAGAGAREGAGTGAGAGGERGRSKGASGALDAERKYATVVYLLAAAVCCDYPRSAGAGPGVRRPSAKAHARQVQAAGCRPACLLLPCALRMLTMLQPVRLPYCPVPSSYAAAATRSGAGTRAGARAARAGEGTGEGARAAARGQPGKATPEQVGRAIRCAFDNPGAWRGQWAACVQGTPGGEALGPHSLGTGREWQRAAQWP